MNCVRNCEGENPKLEVKAAKSICATKLYRIGLEFPKIGINLQVAIESNPRDFKRASWNKNYQVRDGNSILYHIVFLPQATFWASAPHQLQYKPCLQLRTNQVPPK